MQINIIAMGNKMSTWVNQAYSEYSKRMPSEYKLKITEISLTKRTKNTDIKRTIQQEGEKMLAVMAKNSKIIALERKGQAWSTEQLAENLQHWQTSGHNLSLLIGGPEGLAPECLQQTNQLWSLSSLTLPHPLVRIIVAEQLYRAWTILTHHPYHRAED